MSRAATVALGFLVLVLPLELGARLWAARRGDALDRARPLLRLDERLGWRQRAGLDAVFYGRRVRTDARGFRRGPLDTPPRALVLGPSSAFGWGVGEEESYPARVGALNAGEIGFSAWQGRALYRGELRGLKPEFVALAYGANDVDRHRFFGARPGSDADALRGGSAAAVRARNALGGLRFLELLARRLLAARDGLACPRLAVPPPLRVPAGEFERLMAGLAEDARADGAKPVFVTTAFRRLSPPERPAGESDEAYRRAAALAGRGRCAEAREALRDARAAEPWRLRRDVAENNRRLRALAGRLRVPLVDADRLLAGSPALLLDAVHPTPEGHRLIAEALSRIIERR